MSLTVGDAFGIAKSHADLGGTTPLIVTPEVIPLAETGLSVPAGDGESRMVQRRATGDADDSMTREYRRGDALRRVHWRATARRGDLMVRQEEQRSLPQARVIVDTLRSGYHDLDTDRRSGKAETDESASFEWVVRMLASVTVHLRRGGFQVAIEESRRTTARRARSRQAPHLGRRGVPRDPVAVPPRRRAAGPARSGEGCREPRPHRRPDRHPRRGTWSKRSSSAASTGTSRSRSWCADSRRSTSSTARSAYRPRAVHRRAPRRRGLDRRTGARARRPSGCLGGRRRRDGTRPCLSARRTPRPRTPLGRLGDVRACCSPVSACASRA